MTELDAFTDAFHRHFTCNPNQAAFLGVDRDLDRLPDPSLERAADQVAEARSLKAELARLDRGALDFNQRLDLDLAALKLDAEIHKNTRAWDGRTRLQQLPTAGDDIGDGLFTLFITDPRPDEDRLADVLGRMQGVPAYTRALLARLDRPLGRWAAIDDAKVEGLPELFGTLTDWAESVNFSELPALRAAAADAVAALQDYRAALRALPTGEALHIGEVEARRIVRNNGIIEPLETLHAWATEFLADMRATLESLRGRLVARHRLPADTTVDGLHTWLNGRFRVALPTGSLDDVLDRYRAEHARILAWNDRAKLFPIFEDQELRILRTPGFMAPSIPAGAMVPPAAFRDGRKVSLVYLTLSHDLLDEHTELGIPNMMIHEGVPGHHLQLATAACHPSVIRRHMDFNDLAEGWTTMLEDYVLDEGYMGDLTDEARFIGKRDISRIGARVAIDLYFMTGDPAWLEVGVDYDRSSSDPFVRAGSLLRNVTGFTEGRLQSELNWYSVERGYPLSYLTGNRLVWGLKRDVAEYTGQSGHELDRRFHQTYLEAGNMPVSFLRRVFEDAGLLSRDSL